MANPERDSRNTGRKRPRHYYQPVERIELVPGVTHKELDETRSLYAGSGEDLEKAGVLRAHMLPAPGQSCITWNAIGARRRYGYAPGHLEIRRQHDGTYRATLAVSDEERDRRKEEISRRNREVQEELEAGIRQRLPEMQRRATEQQAEANLEKPVNAERQRDAALAGCELTIMWLTGGMVRGASGPFSPAKTAALVTMIERLMEAIKGAQLVEPRPAAQRGHLTVAWSAP